MLYNAILLDVFNLTHRHKTSRQNVTLRPIDIANNVINFIERDVKSHLATNGDIYFLYDPLPEILKSDMGMGKNFKVTTARQEICPNYKMNRKQDKSVIEAIKLIRKYYSFRGINIKTCITKMHEADDFVEGIISSRLKSEKIAMVTTDGDWARYISDNVDMINKSFEKPYSVSEYFKEYHMKPTPAVVTFRKAILGDESDDLPNITKLKKIKFYCDVENVIHNFLIYISSQELSLEEVEKRLKELTETQLISKRDRDPIQELAYTLQTVAIPKEADNPWGRLWLNERVIKCRCENTEKYIVAQPEDKKYIELMEHILERSEKNKKFSFGKIKI